MARKPLKGSPKGHHFADLSGPGTSQRGRHKAQFTLKLRTGLRPVVQMARELRRVRHCRVSNAAASRQVLDVARPKDPDVAHL